MLVDFTASLATVSAVREAVAAGAELERPWLLDHDGKPTRDPRVLEVLTERGSLMLLGGMEAGHKGFRIGADRGSADAGAERPRPPRWTNPMGRERIPAADRSQSIREPGRVRSADGFLRRSMPRLAVHRSGSPGAAARGPGRKEYRQSETGRSGFGAHHDRKPAQLGRSSPHRCQVPYNAIGALA